MPSDSAEQLQRRIFLLYGWGRWLALRASQTLEQQEHILKTRKGGRWAILVADDYWACQYQRLHFRLQRARFAFRGYGMSGYASYGEHGFVRATPEEVDERNRQNFHKHKRMRAHKALMRIRELEADARSPGQAVEEDRDTKAREDLTY